MDFENLSAQDVKWIHKMPERFAVWNVIAATVGISVLPAVPVKDKIR